MGSEKEFYERYWGGLSSASDRDPIYSARVEALLGTLRRGIRASGTVLDLGCGAGEFSAVIGSAGYDVLGVDIADRAISLARTRNAGVRFDVLGPGGRIPARSGAFAAVWTSEVVEHVLDVNGFLREIHRVLEPNGLLILTTPYHGLLKNLVLCSLWFERHFQPDGPHIRFFDRRGLGRCLDRSGFTPLKWKGLGRVPGFRRSFFVVARKSSL